jgi:hypothetical protein
MQKGITTIEEVRNDDASFRQSNPVRKSVNEQNAPKRQVSKGRFTNFPQRNYSNSDLAEFERRKLSGKKD